MNKELKTYIRKIKKNRAGEVVASKKIGMVVCKKRLDGAITIGWSLCNKKDEYDDRLGYLKASSRQYALDSHRFEPSRMRRGQQPVVSEGTVLVPMTAYDPVWHMIFRAKRYFKPDEPAF